MSSYPQRVFDNIIPLSVASDLPKAFDEWYFTNRTEDHEHAIEDCELCDQEQLRYHFEIANRLTRKCLWVGSSCILRFQVTVFSDNGIKLDRKSAESKLNEHIKNMRIQSCINSLKKLAEDEHNPILSNALNYYQSNKYLTPKFAFVVLWRLKENKIDHHPSFFKISLNKQRYKDDLKDMQESRVHLIWPALTSSQKKIAQKLGHTEPST